MSRHFWHACGREGGFTFVELLVTIIIAGLAFAAMVPVFVGASEASSGDIARNAALQLAQDKLEKVRGLDYDVITTDGLTNDTIPNAQFGTTVSWSTGGGGTRTYNVSYVVELIGSDGSSGAVAGTEAYKQVTITASWTAPPAPVKPVVLSTMICQQYAGPEIIRFDIGPDSVLDTTASTTKIVSGPVDLDAYIAPEDIASMNQSATEENRGYVLFTVTAVGGAEVASQKVSTPVTGEPAHYRFEWDNSTAADDAYILQAVAVAGFGSRAQGMPVSIALQYINHAPPAPDNLSALPGDGSVTLGWTAPAAADLDHYEVQRSTDGVSFTTVGTSENESYVDTDVTNGTLYYYRVHGIDAEGLSGLFSDVVSATPNPPADQVAPSIPSPLTATVDTSQATVHLTWGTSVDYGTPTSGLAGYVLERLESGSSTWETVQSLYQGTIYDDTTAGWSTTWTYRVQAVDLAGNRSGYAEAGPVTTVAPILRTIQVTNNSSIQIYVWIQNVATDQWYGTSGTASSSRPSSGTWVKKNGRSVTWTNIPNGLYNVFFLSSSSWNDGNIKKTLAVDVNTANGTATYP